MKKSKIIIILIIVLALIGGAVAGFLLYNNSSSVKLKKQLKLGDKYMQEEEYEQAIAAYEAAIEIDPLNKDAYIGLASAYIELEDYDTAKEVLEEGIEILQDEDMDKDAKKLQKKLDKVQKLIDESKAEAPGTSEVVETYEEPQDEVVVEETVIDSREIYQEVIDDYIAFYAGDKKLNQTSIYQMFGDNSSITTIGTYDNPWLGTWGDDTYMEADSEYMYGDALYIEAKFYDVNNDGIEEMFIVEIEEGNYSNMIIHDVWTIVNKKPKYVTYSDVRYELILADDGTLKQCASSGANSNTGSTLTLNSNGELETIDYVAEVPEGEGSYYEHNGERIAKDEYDRLSDPYWSKSKMDLSTLDGVSIAKWIK